VQRASIVISWLALAGFADQQGTEVVKESMQDHLHECVDVMHAR
jgi:hypothetical protein